MSGAQPDGFTISAGTGAAAADFAGGRRRSKKLRVVKKSTVRRMLKAKGLKMRGGMYHMGGDAPTAPGAPPATGGRRRRKTGRKTRRRSLFGVKY